MLFSEPKIPQCAPCARGKRTPQRFSALQRAENSSISRRTSTVCGASTFQCSSASRKFLNFGSPHAKRPVSARFSALQRAENSSIQASSVPASAALLPRFSALQRAENSSINWRRSASDARTGFQCSSASRKFLNHFKTKQAVKPPRVSVLFSEPKIPQSIALGGNGTNDLFQCSSASRKFLNLQEHAHSVRIRQVSVLFSEPKIPQSRSSYRMSQPRTVSVLFSEPKIPQSLCRYNNTNRQNVSVLFSEPKIPQSHGLPRVVCIARRFSALQRAENSSMLRYAAYAIPLASVSVLFSEPKIPQSLGCLLWRSASRCFSALQRAENSSILLLPVSVLLPPQFQCSSASRKFLNALHVHRARKDQKRFQCSSASRKFLNQISREWNIP